MLELLLLVGISELKLFFDRKEIKKRENVIASNYSTIKKFNFKKFRYLEYLLYGIGGAIIGISTYIALNHGISQELIEAISLGTAILYFPVRFFQANTIFISDIGIVLNQQNYFFWEDVTKIDWDKDINQKLWGVRIYSTKQKIPFKFYINRKFKKQLEELINLYLTNYQKRVLVN